MKLQPGLVELVVSDMASTLAFYRRLGLDIPADADDQPHVDIHLDGGMRFAFDTEETIRSFDRGWSPPSGGHRMALAFACESPDQVDAAFSELTASSYEGHLPDDARLRRRGSLPLLRTARLTLRQMSADDLDEMAALLAGPEVMRYYPAPKSR
jgi:catechol 2,3-dioxygenase-like lactoylglutathione lyase family enzyme